MNEPKRRALVTGGARGIGWAIASALRNAGVDVVLHDLGAEGAARAAEIGATYVSGDLADPEQVARLAEAALAAGPIDILVNNAGFQHVAPVAAFPDDVWQRMIQVMLTAPFQLTKRVLPGMTERGWGRVVNIVSIHGLVASPFKSAYVAAKHGLIGLTKTAALEVGAEGVTVNAICPSYVRTALVEAQIESQAQHLGIDPGEVVRSVMLEPVPNKRLLEPEEVAGLVLFLASDAAAAVNGAAYTMDLGWTAR